MTTACTRIEKSHGHPLRITDVKLFVLHGSHKLLTTESRRKSWVSAIAGFLSNWRRNVKNLSGTGKILSGEVRPSSLHPSTREA